MPIVSASAIKYIFFPGGNNLPVSLGDDLVGDKISGGDPSFDPKTEAVLFGGSDVALLIEHGNAVYSLSWRVDRYHGTPAVARKFRVEHPQSIPAAIGIAAGVLQELLDDGTFNFFQNCTRPKCKCVSWSGASTIFEYSVQFGRVTTTQN